MLKLQISHHEHKEDECQIIVTGLIIDKLDQHSSRNSAHTVGRSQWGIMAASHGSFLMIKLVKTTLWVGDQVGRTSNSMTALVVDKNWSSSLERLDLEASRRCEQDLILDLCWMLRNSSCQDYGACSRFHDLTLFAKAHGWVRLAEYVLRAAERKDVLSEVPRVDDMDDT